MKKLILIMMLGSLFAQESPCKDETYIELKKKKLDEMSDREYEYFLVKDKQCNEYISNSKNKKSYVPEELRPVYGVTDPCDNPMLKYTMEEIRALDDLDINLYTLHSEECDSYKQAKMDLEVKAMAREKTYHILRKVFFYVGIAGLYFLLQ